MRFDVRVRPGARRAQVGGEWGEARLLMVAVREPATDGRANAAVRKAIAAALDVPRSRVEIVGGVKSRTKRIEVTEPPPQAEAVLAELRQAN